MPDLLLASIKTLGTAATAAALFLTVSFCRRVKLQLNALIAIPLSSNCWFNRLSHGV